ncbi:substrate-binding periplasmic protein [Marinobacter sp. 1Y8]
MAPFSVRWLICFCLVSILMPAGCASASKLPELRVGYIEFPPFNYTDESGEPAGPWVDMTETVAQSAGYTVKWMSLPIARVYLYLEQGNIDLWLGVADLPVLEGKVVESTSSPMSIRLMAFHKKGVPDITSVPELEGKRLLLIAGFTYLNILKNVDLDPAKTAVAPNHHAALTMMQLGRADYLLNYDEPVYAEQRKFPELALEGAAIYQLRGAFVVSREHPDAQRVADRLDAAYQSLIASGQLRHLQHGRRTPLNDDAEILEEQPVSIPDQTSDH